ncbi:uncharacterized protein GGS22DRAFT_158210 [Annulohypoxylon maeteangense]|uniref:uncharacterized protein n=1 Tax=Annulohypoxylon maeteangense TaxID=1927788 RepID=UPI00200766B1|nr:uncharacterized protein GGS22DRAFT_158210 [Annulohypoxylon maeteangense]KAI0886596.1 hypothetical protein GGS22DRAFT_158210 [Annulohypoxylon maeteangense]
MNFLISDIQEKEVTEPKAPNFPQIKSTTTGFPEHKKRTRISTFKQKRQGARIEGEEQKESATSKDPFASTQDAQSTSSKDFKSYEKQAIDRENNEKLDTMSPEEIEAARQELFNGLDPSVLQMLLKRANLDEPKKNDPFDIPDPTQQDVTSTNLDQAQEPPKIQVEDTTIQSKSIATENTPTEQQPADNNGSKRVRWASVADEADEEATTIPKPTPAPPSDSTPNPPATESNTTDTPETNEPQPKPHWPHPPNTEIDPSDPDFLSKLHTKYFPSLPADPSKLAWMAPIPTTNSPADYDSPYHPSQDSLPVSALRFNFRGELLPPRISRVVPSTKGLHHHGEAPEAAGYTVRELARLCRSAVPGQRCLAYQTLGRILYRLGRGEFGGAQDGMARGVWEEVEEGAVMRSLHEEAGMEEGRGHMSAKAFAVEAVWLFEKGGWKERLRRGKA